MLWTHSLNQTSFFYYYLHPQNKLAKIIIAPVLNAAAETELLQMLLNALPRYSALSMLTQDL